MSQLTPLLRFVVQVVSAVDEILTDIACRAVLLMELEIDDYRLVFIVTVRVHTAQPLPLPSVL